MFRMETWAPKLKENYIVLDREGGKDTVAIAIENGNLIVAVYNGKTWIVKAKNPMSHMNLWKLEQLIKTEREKESVVTDQSKETK